jgi:hypothetical protein
MTYKVIVDYRAAEHNSGGPNCFMEAIVNGIYPFTRFPI